MHDNRTVYYHLATCTSYMCCVKRNVCNMIEMGVANALAGEVNNPKDRSNKNSTAASAK